MAAAIASTSQGRRAQIDAQDARMRSPIFSIWDTPPCLGTDEDMKLQPFSRPAVRSSALNAIAENQSPPLATQLCLPLGFHPGKAYPLTTKDFATHLSETAKAVDSVLLELFTATTLPGETERPARVTDSMRYAALAGGKRLRPFLVVETARLFGVEGQGVLRAAAAIECVHCYSLVHDDLPAMDDDDLRRGQPTTHRKFDEATAILAGDALLTYAFDILADEPTAADANIRVALVKTLARASGLGGMVGGQLLDLEAEGRFHADGQPLQLDDVAILKLQAMKTGALLLAGVQMGAIIAGASAAEIQKLERYGRALGQAFQIADDLLDEEADAATVGKATGKDAAKGKGTLVRLWGKEAARQRLAALVTEAEAALEGFGDKAETLREAARFVANRDR